MYLVDAEDIRGWMVADYSTPRCEIFNTATIYCSLVQIRSMRLNIKHPGVWADEKTLSIISELAVPPDQGRTKL